MASRNRRSAELSRELEATLLRELAVTWGEINRSLFKSTLRPPVLRLSSNASFLGRWLTDTRVLELSRELVLENRWGQVVEVLKHEMAHQYVHEVLGVHDESAHGPAFRKVCQRIGIDAAASGLPGGGEENPQRERLLRRIAGLLALAESTNRYEAESATAQAQRLMLKHNLAVSESGRRQRYGFRHLGEPKGRVPEAEHILAAILADHMFVEAIWVPAFRPHDGKRGSVLEICGSYENLEMACYAHAFLLGTAEHLWSEHKRAKQIRSNRDRRSYIAGVMEGFRERLNSEKKRAAKQGLVWVGDADLSHYYRRRHPYVRTVRLRGHGRSDTRAHGREAGRKIVLHKGVKGAARNRGRVLPPKR